MRKLLCSRVQRGTVTDSTGQRQGWQPIHRHVEAGCAAAGLDLAQPLQVGWYNAAVESNLRLPDFGRPRSLAILIGNSRALWGPFLAAARRDASLRRAPHPVERYTTDAVTAAVRELGVDVELRWAHTLGPGMVAMQRLAAIAGLAHLSPARLAVHPRFGPWIALRAVAVIDMPGPAGVPPSLAPPCDDCEAGCRRALRELEALPAGTATWRHWLAVRDACPLGRQHRYDDDQIEYHYTKARCALDRALGSGT